MGKLNVVSKVLNKMGKAGLWIRRHAPEIQTGVSVTTSLTGAGFAGWGTLRADKKIKDAKAKLEEIEAMRKDDPDGYSEDDYKHDKLVVKANLAKDVGLSYAPAAACEAVSIFTNINSTRILRKENLALAAAYVALDKSYKAYKDGVHVEEVAVKDPDGKETTEHMIMEPDDVVNPYEFIFDCTNKYWQDDLQMNIAFLTGRQNMVNNKLRARGKDGYMFLNEVCGEFGLPQTKAGQYVGWTMHGDGDKFIDCGMYSIDDGSLRVVRTGDSPHDYAIKLNFNVDGPIMYVFDDLDKQFEARVARED